MDADIVNVTDVRSVNLLHKFTFGLWILFNFICRTVFLVALVNELWQRAAIHLYLLFVMVVLSNILTFWKFFGWSSNTISWGLVSLYTPAEFLHKDKTTTVRYGLYYHLMMDGFILSYIFLDWLFFKRLMFSYLLPVLALLSIPKLFQKLHYVVSIQPLFHHCHLAYPDMRKVTQREASFPPNELVSFPDYVDISYVISEGHFYADTRIRKPVTKCFTCDFDVYWASEEPDEIVKLHEDRCQFDNCSPSSEVVNLDEEQSNRWNTLLASSYRHARIATVIHGLFVVYSMMPASLLVWPGTLGRISTASVPIFWTFCLLHMYDNEKLPPFKRSCFNLTVHFMSLIGQALQSMLWYGVTCQNWLPPVPVMLFTDVAIQCLSFVVPFVDLPSNSMKSITMSVELHQILSLLGISLQVVIIMGPLCYNAVRKLLKHSQEEEFEVNDIGTPALTAKRVQKQTNREELNCHQDENPEEILLSPSQETWP